MGFKAYTPCSQSFRRFFAVIFVCYKKAISPYLPMACRFYPTCSVYAKEAILQHGLWKGLKLTLWRLGRCHPFGGHGIDFVPLPDDCEQR